MKHNLTPPIGRKNLILSSLGLGILIILVWSILENSLNFFFLSFIARHQDLNNPFNYLVPAIILGLILKILSLCSIVFAGYMVGYRMKQNGWFYGAIVGLVWFTFTLLIALIPLLLLLDRLLLGNTLQINQYTQSYRGQSISTLLSHIPLNLLETVGLCSIGGILGEYIVKRRKI